MAAATGPGYPESAVSEVEAVYTKDQKWIKFTRGAITSNFRYIFRWWSQRQSFLNYTGSVFSHVGHGFPGQRYGTGFSLFTGLTRFDEAWLW